MLVYAWDCSIEPCIYAYGTVPYMYTVAAGGQDVVSYAYGCPI